MPYVVAIVQGCLHAYTYLHTQVAVDRTDTHTHAHTHAYSSSCVCTNTHISGRASNSTSRSASITHTHRQLSTGDLVDDDTHTHTHARARLLFQLFHIFLLHVYTSVSLACMRRYTQLAYLFHQCATSFLSRDGCIADCTVRHPGVQRPFSSFYMCGYDYHLIYE